VGFLRLIDRDTVSLVNLHRQVLYTEEDARRETPKAAAAAERLARINSSITIEPVVADVNAANIEAVISGVDIALDGSDNFELRFLLNEACHKHHIPWIYGGAIGAAGGSMNILPGGPCFRCLMPELPPPGSQPTCVSAGVLNMITGVIACVEAAEAIKILTGSPAVSRQYRAIDLWENTADCVTVQPNPACPVCAKGEYSLLGTASGMRTIRFCGEDSAQVTPPPGTTVDLAAVAAQLAKTGSVQQAPFMVQYRDGKTSFLLFADGRAIIKQVKDEAAAKSIYAEYIGL
jgi:adenylyltransferase/sulfurtransferase